MYATFSLVCHVLQMKGTLSYSWTSHGEYEHELIIG